MKEIKIEYATVYVPARIEIDGIVYPRHQWNFNVIKEYEKTKDEKVLDKLKDFSLDFT